MNDQRSFLFYRYLKLKYLEAKMPKREQFLFLFVRIRGKSIKALSLSNSYQDVARVHKINWNRNNNKNCTKDLSDILKKSIDKKEQGRYTASLSI